MTALDSMIVRFVPVDLTADISSLSEGDRTALTKLMQAARIIDTLFLEQKWSGDLQLLARIGRDSTPEGLKRLHYFWINIGPWSDLDEEKPFIEGVPPQPPYANYYPPDMTKEEFNRWVATLPPDEQAKAKGFFWVIRRDSTGALMLVPYSVEYRKYLEPAAQLLREASEATTFPTLRTFLARRAQAFLDDDYFDSDVAWMDLDSPLDVTFGPYEVYMDKLFNYKAAFEAFINIRNEEESSKLRMFSGHLQDVENHLPIEARYRNPKLGALSPIAVADEVFTGGEARKAVKTAAYNLPNDERVTRQKGNKRVMLKNVQEAKFKSVLIPISQVLIDSSQQSLIAFEPFFTFILAHELMHGLGPHVITVNGKKTTVRQEMKELSSALEEAKADVSGIWMMQYLMDSGVIDKAIEKNLYATYFASIFRSIRFGLTDAHGKANALEFNFLNEEGAFSLDETRHTYTIDFDKMKTGLTKLTSLIMTIQAEGSYAKAQDLIEGYGAIRPMLQASLDRLATIPVDIDPHFVLADQLLDGHSH